MKEYKIQNRNVNRDTWFNIDGYFYDVDSTKKRIEEEKRYDYFYKKNPDEWEYRILVREIPDWEVYNG